MNATGTSHVLRWARIAGVLYLVIIVLGVWSEGFVRSRVIVANEPATTAANILASIGAFQMSLVADSVMLLCDVALAVLLFVLLEPVNRVLAMMAAAFRLVQASVLGVNLLNQQVALALLSPSSEGGGFIESTRDGLVLLFAQAQERGYDLGLLFFGINCVVTGYLVFKSGFLPRALGVLLAASGPVYLAGSYLSLLAPHRAVAFDAAYLLPLLAETSFCLWLLLKGVNVEAWKARAT